MKKIGILNIFFIFLIISVQAQTLDKELEFGEYLIQNNLNVDWIRFAEKLKLEYSLSDSINESINYQLGISYFLNQKKDASFNYFFTVNMDKELTLNARIFQSQILTEQQLYDSAYNLMAKAPRLSNIYSGDIRTYYLAALSLLKKDTLGFKVHRSNLNISNQELTSLQNNLDRYKESMILKKKKSPLLAAVYSGIIPGLGKIYVGKPKQGFASFITIGALGGQTFEAYKKRGTNSVRFIFFATLTSIFYIGNIWGSALSVYVNRNEIYEQVEHQICADLTIPIDYLIGSRR